ncbi:MAG: hypothetical protein FWG65_11000 [Turicibacter sp.]|nr:hypothetical protein [Turicibacter sp.]
MIFVGADRIRSQSLKHQNHGRIPPAITKQYPHVISAIWQPRADSIRPYSKMIPSLRVLDLRFTLWYH